MTDQFDGINDSAEANPASFASISPLFTELVTSLAIVSYISVILMIDLNFFLSANHYSELASKPHL